MANKISLNEVFDLSFTFDKTWIKARKERFKQRAEGLKSDFRAKKINAIENFYLTGIVTDPDLYNPLNSDSASGIEYFPLINEETIGFFFSKIYIKQTIYEQYFWTTLGNKSDFLHTLEESLELFDFFHNDELVDGINKTVSELGIYRNVPNDELRVSKLLFENLVESLNPESGSSMHKTFNRIDTYFEAIVKLYNLTSPEFNKLLNIVNIIGSWIKEDFEAGNVVNNSLEILDEFNEKLQALNPLIGEEATNKLIIEV